MNKKHILLFTLTILIIVYILRSSDNLLTTTMIPNKQEIKNNQTTHEVRVQRSRELESKQDPSNILNYPKIAYEDDWCVRGVDLTEKDLKFAEQESDDWAEKRGNLFFNIHDYKGDYRNLDNSDLLEPYREMNKEELLKLTLNSNRYAMIAAVLREDVSIDIQKSIAEKLVVLGDTSIALLYLAMNNMVMAKYEYNKQQSVTQNVKHHMKDALVYVSYGISRYDTTALSNYISSLNGVFKEELHPTNVLSTHDFDDVRHKVQALSELIDKLREKNNLMPISQEDIPKIAEHEFQENLAILYLEYGQDLDKLQFINLEKGPNIKRSDCVRRYADLYGN